MTTDARRLLLGYSRFKWFVVAGLLVGVAPGLRAQGFQTFQTPQALLGAMIAQERDSAARHERYEYLSVERSDRTGGHAWTERVVETSQGKVRLLLAEDGMPITAERTAQERGRLAEIVAHPDLFSLSEEARMTDEAHARAMLNDLPKGFLLENVTLTDGVWRVNFRPNPKYSPSGIEEHVLHGMSGWLAIDAKDLRQHRVWAAGDDQGGESFFERPAVHRGALADGACDDGYSREGCSVQVGEPE